MSVAGIQNRPCLLRDPGILRGSVSADFPPSDFHPTPSRVTWLPSSHLLHTISPPRDSNALRAILPKRFASSPTPPVVRTSTEAPLGHRCEQPSSLWHDADPGRHWCLLPIHRGAVTLISARAAACRFVYHLRRARVHRIFEVEADQCPLIRSCSPRLVTSALTTRRRHARKGESYTSIHCPCRVYDTNNRNDRAITESSARPSPPDPHVNSGSGPCCLSPLRRSARPPSRLHHRPFPASDSRIGAPRAR